MKLDALQEAVAGQIVQCLEQGVTPWTKPWVDGGISPHMPANAVTGREYSGVNVLILWLTGQMRGWSTGAWLTYEQANKVNAKVKKGEKGTGVVYSGQTQRKKEGQVVLDKDGQPEMVRVLKTFTVFNVAQIERLPPQYAEPVYQKLPEDERYTAALAFFEGTGIKTAFEGAKAAYNHRRDHIIMPEYARFESDEAFFQTWAHELIHATGHESRLNRVFGKRFADDQYAAEEIVAELGAAFLCAKLGFAPQPRENAQYLQVWLKAIKKDPVYIFQAASYASRAVDWLWESSVYSVNGKTPDVERPKAA